MLWDCFEYLTIHNSKDITINSDELNDNSNLSIVVSLKLNNYSYPISNLQNMNDPFLHKHKI